ncbi:MAG: hypothetical protein RR057_04200, partial [Clostridia bacterium]
QNQKKTFITPKQPKPQQNLSELQKDEAQVLIAPQKEMPAAKKPESAIKSTEKATAGKSAANKKNAVLTFEPQKENTPDESDCERAIIKLMKNNSPLTADEISVKTKFSVSEVLATLTILEVYGKIYDEKGGKYRLI